MPFNLTPTTPLKQQTMIQYVLINDHGETVQDCDGPIEAGTLDQLINLMEQHRDDDDKIFGNDLVDCKILKETITQEDHPQSPLELLESH